MVHNKISSRINMHVILYYLILSTLRSCTFSSELPVKEASKIPKQIPLEDVISWESHPIGCHCYTSYISHVLKERYHVSCCFQAKKILIWKQQIQARIGENTWKKSWNYFTHLMKNRIIEAENMASFSRHVNLTTVLTAYMSS